MKCPYCGKNESHKAIFQFYFLPIGMGPKGHICLNCHKFFQKKKEAKE